MVVAIANQKGGTAKTTTAINLSAGLALQGKKTLLVDLDPQAHSTIGLGISTDSFKFAIHDVFLKTKQLSDIIIKTKVDNLDVAPSHIKLNRVKEQLTTELYREQLLSKALHGHNYDFIIIDCQPDLGILTVNAIFASDFIIAPCEISRFALEGFADFMDTVSKVKNGNARDISKSLRLLLTKYDSRNKNTNDWLLEQLKDSMHIVFKTYIRKNEAINQAHIAREPIFLFKKDSQGAADYKKLVTEFLELCHQTPS